MSVKIGLKKVIIYSLLIMLLFNFLISAFACKPVLASEEKPKTEVSDKETAEAEAASEALVSSRMNGPAGILTWVIRLIFIAPITALQLETFFVADSAGHEGEVSLFVTPLDIFFNKFTLVDINIFSVDGLDKDGLVYGIRTNAAMFYWAVLVLAGVYELFVLFKVGYNVAMVRNSKGSTPDDNRRAIELIGNWVISMALILVMHFFIRGVLEVNNILVGIIEDVTERAEIGNVMDSILTASFSDSFLVGMASTIVYVIMVFQTMIFLFVYIIRLLKVTLLIIISPAVGATYATDKASYKSALKLESWLRAFLSNVFIQVIHCLIYAATVGVALSQLAKTGVIDGLETLGVAVVAIISMFFVKKAEEMLKEIFGFNRSVSLTSYSSVSNSINNAVYRAASIGAGALGAGAVGGLANNQAGESMTPFGQNVDNNGANSNANAGKLSFGERIGSKLQYAKTQLLGGGSLNSSNRVSTSVSNENASGVDSTEESISENGEPLRIGTNKNMEQNDSEETNTNEQIENNDVLRKTDDEENKNESKDELEKENRSKIEKAIEQTKRGKKTSNITEEEEENTDKKEEGKDKENSDSQKNQEIDSDQFKNLYKEISSNIANLHEAEELLEQKLESIGENLEPDEKKTIENNINKLDFEDAKEYVDSLEGTPQGEYAKTYLNLSETKKAIGNEEDKVDSLIDEGAKSGLIDKATEAALIAGGSVGLSALSKVKSNKPRKEDEKAIIEEGEEIESTEFLNPEIKAQHEISASAVKDEIIKDKTFGDLTKENAKILNELEGEVTIQGDISDEKLREFNIKILNKVRNNAYSQSNFQEAQNRVRKEGIKAMRKLQDFRNNPNVETARELSPGGKEYAKLMVEAQQAEMIIRAVKVSTEENTTVDKKVTESVTQTSSSVLNNLSNRRKNAMK